MFYNQAEQKYNEVLKAKPELKDKLFIVPSDPEEYKNYISHIMYLKNEKLAYQLRGVFFFVQDINGNRFEVKEIILQD